MIADESPDTRPTLVVPEARATGEAGHSAVANDSISTPSTPSTPSASSAPSTSSPAPSSSRQRPGSADARPGTVLREAQACAEAGPVVDPPAVRCAPSSHDLEPGFPSGEARIDRRFARYLLYRDTGLWDHRDSRGQPRQPGDGVMPGAEGHGEALEPTGQTDGQPIAGSVSGTQARRPRAPAVEYPEEAIPGQWVTVASSPTLCVAHACELLDAALDADITERGSLVALARGWLRAAEIAGRIQAQEQRHRVGLALTTVLYRGIR